MTKLIIDTDVALGVYHEGRPRDIDDGFAIVEAINNPAIDLLGITCVYGNGPIDEVYRVANELVTLKSVEIPVIKGAERRLQSDADPKNPTVSFIADELRKGRLTIAAIGPLTNMALLVTHHPELLDNIEQMIIVAGRTEGADFYIGEQGPVNDFNFENDALAAEVVMQAGIPMVLMGFELTSQVAVTASDLETILTHDSPTAQYFYDNSQAWCKYWTETFPVDAGFHPWDSATISWLTNPEWFVHEQRGHKVSYEPKLLNCDVGIPGAQHTYCTGFTPGGAEAFVQGVVKYVY